MAISLWHIMKGQGGMRLAYSTLACPRWSIEEAVAAAVRYGYDAIEWRLADGAIIEPGTPVSVRRRLREVPAANGIVCGLFLVWNRISVRMRKAPS